MAEAVVRARHLKQTLEGIATLPERDAIRAAIGDGVVRAVETAHGVDWLPIDHDLAIVRAEFDVLGAERQARLARDVVNASFRGPLLGRLVESAMRLTGQDPSGWARWVPRAWTLMFSGCGTWMVGAPTPDRTVVLRLAGLPPILVDDDRWPRSLASSLSAIVDLGRAIGGTTLERLDPVAREATFALRWTPAAVS